MMFVLLAASTLTVANTNAAPATMTGLSSGPFFLRMFLALGFTILLTWIILKTASRHLRPSPGGKAGRTGRAGISRILKLKGTLNPPGNSDAISMELLDQMPLDQQHHLYLVKVGVKTFLIATGNNGVNSLGEIHMDSAFNPNQYNKAEQSDMTVEPGLEQQPEETFSKKSADSTEGGGNKSNETRQGAKDMGSEAPDEYEPGETVSSSAYSLTGSSFVSLVVFVFLLFFLAKPAFGAPMAAQGLHPLENSPVLLQPHLLTPLLILGATLAPLLILCLSSFVKFAIVFSLLRSALGTPTIPPNLVITGISLLFTIIIMAPVFEKSLDEANLELPALLNEGKIPDRTVINNASMPIRQFLKENSNEDELLFFAQMAASQPDAPAISDHSVRMQVLAPAFIISELKEAFLIGFLIFIPFMVIDMVVANLLLATGLSGMSPALLALPFKLLLFVACDGWVILTRGLFANYLPIR